VTEPAPPVTQDLAADSVAAVLAPCAVAVFAAVTCVRDGGELRAALARVRRPATRTATR
jgi:hypothetical protein